MLGMCQDLRHIRRARDQKLSLQKEEASTLNGRVEGLEKNMKGLFFSLFSQDNQHGDSAVSNTNAAGGYKKLSPAATLPEDTMNKTDGLSESPILVSTKGTQTKHIFSTFSTFLFECLMFFDLRQAAEILGSCNCCGAVKQNQRYYEVKQQE